MRLAGQSALHQTQVGQIREMNARQVADTLHAFKQLIEDQELIANLARRELIRIGEDFAFEAVDRLRKSGVKLEECDPQVLGDLVRKSLAAQSRIARGSESIPKRLVELTEESAQHFEENKDLRKELQLKENQIRDFERKIKSQMLTLQDRDQALSDARDEIKALQTRQNFSGMSQQYRKAMNKEEPLEKERQYSLIDLKMGEQSNGKAKDGLDDQHYHNPNWYQLWRDSISYSRDLSLIKIMGETGYCRITELSEEFAKAGLGTAPTLYRAMATCETWQLLERKDGVLPSKGRPTSVAILTDRGIWCYQHEFGNTPKRNEFESMIQAHKHPDHLSLILQTADAFASLGFKVDREPKRIAVDKELGKYFYPDLTVVDPITKESIYIEAERGGNRRKPGNVHKWDNASRAGAGKIWIVTDKINTLNTRIGEVVYWATEKRKPIQVLGTTIEQLTSLSPGDTSLWIRHKDFRSKF